MAFRKSNLGRLVTTAIMLGIVAGFAALLTWFVMPGLPRVWLVTGGVTLALCGSVGWIISRPQREEY